MPDGESVVEKLRHYVEYEDNNFDWRPALQPSEAGLVLAAVEAARTELDDAIKAAVNGDWSQDDYDRWDQARQQIEALYDTPAAATAASSEEERNG